MDQSDRVHLPNHTVDLATGFIESNAYPQAFDAKKKLAFLELYKQNGLKMHRTCKDVGVKYETFAKHYRDDPVFHKAFEDAKTEYFDELEGVSRSNALNPRSVIERIFQLKSFFPEKYGDGKRDSGNIHISLSIDGKTMELSQKREEIIEAEIISQTEKIDSLDGKKK